MTEVKATNVHWHDGEVSREDRNALLKQKGATLCLPACLAAVKARSPLLWKRR